MASRRLSVPEGVRGAFAFIKEFRETFHSIQELVERVLSGSCRQSPFRSLIWRVLLGVLDEEGGEGFKGDWSMSLSRCRGRYESLLIKHEFDVRGRARDLEKDNPLSTDSSSSWNQYFLNSELREEILRDVVRTYPGNPLFRSQTMQNSLTDILFIYAKEFPSISYKQGMHEILAAVLLVIKEDMETYVVIKGDLESSDPQLSSLLKVIFDPLYTEHDAYCLFESIMHRMVDWYWSPPTPSAPAVHLRKKQFSYVDRLFDENKRVEEEEEKLSSPWDREVFNPSKRLQHMWNDILAMNDAELFEHLEDLGIIPTTFGINWLKLLYSRQFFENFAFREIWDVIFATNFILQDYVLVAMLVGIRQQLLKSDNTGCNTLLVSSYPKFVEVEYIVKYALHLFDGVRYPRPKERDSPQKRVSFSSSSGLIRRNSKTRDSPRRILGSSFRVISRKEQPQAPLRREESSPTHSVPAVHKSVELVEYLSEDEVKQSLESMRGRISSWKTGLDINVEFLRNIFRGEDIKEIEKFDRALANLKEISGEMRTVLRSHSRKAGEERKPASGTFSSSFGEEALSLIGNHQE